MVDPRALSARVLEAAAGPGAQAQAAFVNSILAEPAYFTFDDGDEALLEPVDLTEEQKRPLRFTALLTRDCPNAGCKGDRVPVVLDLFGDAADRGIMVGAASHHLQLLVGPRFDRHDFKRLTAAHAEAAGVAEQ